ncbi:hypothetical protein B0H12DRAFT_1232096 [Mycena haematopus]|nr:hypothetical protein B0H12DRAFT_1232096 [Mycena haematopus]
MNNFYSHTAAATAVQQWNERLSQPDAPFSKIELAMPASPLDTSRIRMEMTDGGRGARAFFPGDYVPPREAIFTVVGVLHTKDLPPVNKDKAKGGNAKNLRQHASVIGYNTAHFERAVENIQELSFNMSRLFGEDDIRSWQPTDTSPRNGPSMSANCRYFTLGYGVSEELKTKFDEKTDPHGVLSNVLSDTVSHCFDNNVTYLALVGDSYQAHDPASFKIGDIVEIGFALVAWKLAQGPQGPTYVSNLVLRSLTFLDGTYTKESHINKLKAEQEMYGRNRPGTVVYNQLAVEVAKRKAESSDSVKGDEARPETKARTMMVGEVDSSLPLYDAEGGSFSTPSSIAPGIRAVCIERG